MHFDALEYRDDDDGETTGCLLPTESNNTSKRSYQLLEILKTYTAFACVHLDHYISHSMRRFGLALDYGLHMQFEYVSLPHDVQYVLA